MKIRPVVAALAALSIAAASIGTWKALESHQTDQVARIAESESYAARSRLIRDIDALLQTLRNIQEYWTAFGHLPDEWWVADAELELGDFAGLDVLLWHDPENDVRFLRTDEHPAFDHRPDDDEWRAYREVLEHASTTDREAIFGPYATDATHDIHVVIPARRGSGRLIAVIDAERLLEGLLVDSSPGYAIQVRWDDILLYSRGDLDDTPSAIWQREGLIRNSMNVIWRVVHAPGPELAQSLQTPAIGAVMIAGLVIAVLFGLLILENGRAAARAAAAERAERELADLNVDLERQIAERTRELEERSLDLVTIADSVGHDLRNPLNAISMNTGLLELKFSSALGDDGLPLVRKTGANVRRMSEILDRLLGLSVLSNTTFTRERIDMRRLVGELFEALHDTEPGTRVELRLADLPTAHADPTLVRTLLTNLLSNAFKYCRDDDERRIEVGYAMHGDVPEYFVKDNGVGFDEQATERLFRAFERLTHDGGTDGLGLGLHIAARVVRRHGGRIRAEGRAGEGATFYFTLQPGNRAPGDG